MSTVGNHEVYRLTWPDGKYWVGTTLPSVSDDPIYHHYESMGRHPDVKIVSRYKLKVDAKKAVDDFYAAHTNDQNLIIHDL